MKSAILVSIALSFLFPNANAQSSNNLSADCEGANFAFSGAIEGCNDSFGGAACAVIGVPAGGTVQAILNVPQGMPGTIAAGGIRGCNIANEPDTVTPAVALVIEGLGTAFSFANSYALQVDDRNNIISGEVELVFEQTQGGPGTPIIRSFVTTIAANGVFSTVVRNGPTTDEALATVFGSGSWPSNVDDIDFEPPALNLPADIAVTSTGFLNFFNIAQAQASDNISGEGQISIVSAPASRAFRPGRNSIAWTASDIAGNSATAT